MQDLLLKLAEQHPNNEVFKNNSEFQKLIFVESEAHVENPDKLIKMTNSIMAKLTQIFSVKQDKRFQACFGITEEGVPKSQITLPPKSGSLLRQIVVGRE